MKPSGLRRMLAKSGEIFRGLYDYSSGTIQSGFYPMAVGGQASPPINAARSNTGAPISIESSLALSAVWACTWLIADTISTLPFILNQRSGNNTYGQPALDNPLYTVVGSRPNVYMTAVEYWQFMLASEMLWGNAYSAIKRNGAGDVISLMTLLPQWMTPHRLPDTGELRYRYQPGFNDIPIQDFAAADIFHLKDRTLDGLVGLSRIQYARNSIGIAQAGEQATGDTYRNGMRMGGFVSVNKTLTPKQRDDMQGSLDRFKTGQRDSAGMMVLELGMDFKSLTMNPQDAQLLTSRQFSVEDVCRWWNVPPVLIGHAAAGVTSWGTGIEQLLLGFQSLTLRPYIRKIEMSVAASLVQLKDRTKVYLTIDTDDLMGADSAARAALYSTFAQNGVMTRNEIRAKEDMAPMDGGDALTVQSNLTPLDKLGQTPAQPGANDQVDAKPLADPTTLVPKPGDAAEAAQKAIRRLMKRDARRLRRQEKQRELLDAIAASTRDGLIAAVREMRAGETSVEPTRKTFPIDGDGKQNVRKFKRLQITQ